MIPERRYINHSFTAGNCCRELLLYHLLGLLKVIRPAGRYRLNFAGTNVRRYLHAFKRQRLVDPVDVPFLGRRYADQVDDQIIPVLRVAPVNQLLPS